MNLIDKAIADARREARLAAARREFRRTVLIAGAILAAGLLLIIFRVGA